MYDCDVHAVGTNLSASVYQLGERAKLATTLPLFLYHDTLEKSSDCKKRFVLGHSARYPFSVLAGIVAPERVVLKYFTQSTFAP